jgi:hypothetical protein
MATGMSWLFPFGKLLVRTFDGKPIEHLGSLSQLNTGNIGIRSLQAQFTPPLYRFLPRTSLGCVEAF